MNTKDSKTCFLTRLKNTNLLILSSYFPDSKNKLIGGIFIKNQLEYLKDKFNRIDVISMIPYIPKSFVRFGKFEHRKEQVDLKNYTYDNVHVHYIYYYTLPTNFSRKHSRHFLFWKVKKYIETKKIKFDLVHGHFSHPAGYIAVKLKKVYNKPTILTVHEDSSFLRNEISRKDYMLESAWKNSDFIIRVNKRDIPLLKKFNKNVINIPNGFKEKIFHPIDKGKCRRKIRLRNDKKILFTISGLVEQKGHTYAIKAMSKVVKHRKDVIYFIGGFGPLKNSLQKEIGSLGLNDNIKLLGFVPDKDVSLWMNACDIFLLPSLNEGNPTVMFEALGCGKPFLGTNVGGIPEVIINHKLGLLTEPRRPDKLAKNILYALKKKWDYKYISNYAKQFTWKNIDKKILEVYERCLNEDRLQR